MTLGQFLEWLSNSPSLLLFYFVMVPLTALLALVFGKGEGHLSPWKYLYSVLIYLACIPGIFAVTLNAYLFLFERRPVMDTQVFTQIMPVVTMALTLYLIRKNVAFDRIPGFGKIAGLLMILTGLLVIMWLLEKLHIIAITIMPFYIVILIFLAVLLALVFGWRRIVKS